MNGFVAALPMYDWPETRGGTDALWAAIRDRLRAAGIAAPERLARRNADLPAVTGGIRDAAGRVIAPDPATLPPEEFDLFVLWRHPSLLFSQTCWGPMESGLAPHVRVIAQPQDYSDYEGGDGELYSSAIVMRGVPSSASGDAAGEESGTSVSADGGPSLPLDLMRAGRFAFNNPDSMSGLLGISRDLGAAGHGIELFSALVETGSHRASTIAVAEGRADVAAIDCRSWAYVRRFQPEIASRLRVVGWTARRKGLPYICARALPERILQSCASAIRAERILLSSVTEPADRGDAH